MTFNFIQIPPVLPLASRHKMDLRLAHARLALSMKATGVSEKSQKKFEKIILSFIGCIYWNARILFVRQLHSHKSRDKIWSGRPPNFWVALNGPKISSSSFQPRRTAFRPC